MSRKTGHFQKEKSLVTLMFEGQAVGLRGSWGWSQSMKFITLTNHIFIVLDETSRILGVLCNVVFRKQFEVERDLFISCFFQSIQILRGKNSTPQIELSNYPP